MGIRDYHSRNGKRNLWRNAGTQNPKSENVWRPIVKFDSNLIVYFEVYKKYT